jgi:hypothetical protein
MTAERPASPALHRPHAVAVAAMEELEDERRRECSAQRQGAMATSGDGDLQVLATGLAAGVLIDALIVRSLLVPATVSWLGRWSWWMPEHGRRLLRLPAVIPAAESMNTSSARAPGGTTKRWIPRG